MSQTPQKKRRRRQKPVPILTSTIPDREKVDGEPFRLGYARVSTGSQSLQRQVDDLVRYGVAAVDIMSDIGTGSNMDRPGWDLLMKNLEAGDELVIHSLDRMSRDLVHTMTALEELRSRGVRVKVLTLDFDSSTPIGRFIFSIMAAFSQFERDVIVARSVHGLERARERGVFGGTKPKWTKEQIAAAVAEQGSYEGARKKLGCSLITVKRAMAAINKEKITDAKEARGNDEHAD